MTTILLIEDDPAYAELIRGYIQIAQASDLAIEHCSYLSAGLDRLASGGVGLVLLDLTLPDSDGLETFITVRDAVGEVPIIVLTGLDDDRCAASAMREGAQDFLNKNQIDEHALVRSIRYSLDRHAFLSQLDQYADRLSASESRFQAILERGADGIALVDRDGVVQFANHATLQMFGRRKDELVGKPFPFATAAGKSVEVEIPRSGDESLPVEMRLTETMWDGEFALMATFRDLAERRRADRLQSRVEADSLVMKQLRGLDQMKDEFIQTVTHELRTPMTPLRSAVEMFLDGTLGEVTPAQAEMLQVMNRNIQRLARFATDVLALARLDSGRYPIKPREIQLCAVLQPAVELLQQSVRAKRMALSLRCDREVSAHADPDAVSQVITNLVNNAIAHNREGTSIDVEVRRLDDHAVEVAVRDDGGGIPTHVQDRVFGRFVQADRKAGPGYKGTGIGLAVCRSLVEQMGGEISLQSQVGVGSTFCFTLPLDSTHLDILFGRIARALGHVTPEQLDEAIAVQVAFDSGGEPLGDLLVAREYLTTEQRDEILQIQTARLAGPPPGRRTGCLAETLLGTMAVEQGLVSRDQLNECLRTHESLRNLGSDCRLGEVMVQLGHLHPDVIRTLVETQKRESSAGATAGDEIGTTKGETDEEDPGRR